MAGETPCCWRNNVSFHEHFQESPCFYWRTDRPCCWKYNEDLKELADKNAYKKAIQQITQELEEEFQELRVEADKLFTGKKSKTPMEIQTDYENFFDDTIDDNDILGNAGHAKS